MLSLEPNNKRDHPLQEKKEGPKSDIISSLLLSIACGCPNSATPLPHYIFKRLELLWVKALLHNRAPPLPISHVSECDCQHWKRGTEDPLNDQSWWKEDRAGSVHCGAMSPQYIIPPLFVTLHLLPPSSEPSTVHGQWDCLTKIVPCLGRASCPCSGLAIFLVPYQQGIPLDC